MARIPYADVSALPAELQEWHARLPPDSHLFMMVAHSEASAATLMQIGLQQIRELELSARMRELAANATACVLGADYLRVRHNPPGVPMTPEERDAIHRGDHSGFDGIDLAVLTFATAVARGLPVDDDTFAPVRAELSDRQIVELIQVVGYYWMFGQFANVLRIESEPYKK
ncbi:carboxymuconolactone decarboxylase family protein [Streptomyces sp. NPDC088387]|uniref:carboxymuconolactone decarboxylase family protein n=1 Tax=Streptomyces sp. NPDC088387 TaxID=3365859 RepID=UPI0038083D91